ncbi:hypothetical protein, partial [Xanthomonas vasicola]
FRQYISHLCGNEMEQEEINVVIMDRNGKFFAHLTSTNDLRSIFEPQDPDPEWSSSIEIKASVEDHYLDLRSLELAESKKDQPNNKSTFKRSTPS